MAPIFLFTLAEGFFYTRSKGKYMLRLFLGSLFMIIASSIIQKAFPSETIVLMNNIFATMLVAAIYMTAIEMFKASRREKSGK
ncbi:MAG: conjugal transfer protein TraX, partial [Clostridiales bacterium]|nr:conjugal transfer protein TraX [Clostridiales bacterium]